jgi:hypothetical protein
MCPHHKRDKAKEQEAAGSAALTAHEHNIIIATRYAGVSLERVQTVAEALGVKIHERAILPSASGS